MRVNLGGSRGKQGNIVVHNLFLSALYVRTSAAARRRTPPDESRVHPVGRCRVSSRKWLSDFVPKGLSDGRQAIYCLVSVQKREPSSRGRYDWGRQAVERQEDYSPWVR